MFCMHAISFARNSPFDELLFKDPGSTCFVEVGGKGSTGTERVRGRSYTSVPHNEFLGVCTGDILTIDRSIVPILGHLVLAVRDGVFVLGRFTEHDSKRYVVAENGTRSASELRDEDGIYLWGVVTAIVKRLQ